MIHRYTKSQSTFWTVNAHHPGKPPQPGNSGRETPAVTVQQRHPIGPGVPGYYVSETGCTSMSSFESMSATLSPEHWGVR